MRRSLSIVPNLESGRLPWYFQLWRRVGSSYDNTPIHLLSLSSRRYVTTSSKNSLQTKKDGDVAPAPAVESRIPLHSQSASEDSRRPESPPSDWDEDPDLTISTFSELPSTNFGVNQHMIINQEFKEALRQILWQFRAPIRYAFAYGSGVFSQTSQRSKSTSSSLHPHPSHAISTVQGGAGKMIDFIFGVSYTEHWHSLNLHQHRDHYSVVGSLGSWVVSQIQDKWGAGVYFNPYVNVNGTLIKYGVVNLDTLCTDLSEWQTLYLAGRLQKPVKILRDDPRVRLANQINLISAVRTALLLLPETFTEHELYSTIAGISYMGDPRMALPTENPDKVSNIVSNQLPNFRRLYAPLIDNLPNISFEDQCINAPDWFNDPTANARIAQDMDPRKRGNMVRRLPKTFREKLYFAYQSKFQIPQLDFNEMLAGSKDEDAKGIKRREGGVFEQRVAAEGVEGLKKEVGGVIRKTISWPSTSQTVKSGITAGPTRTWRYMRDKSEKYREGKQREVGTGKIKQVEQCSKSDKSLRASIEKENKD